MYHAVTRALSAVVFSLLTICLTERFRLHSETRFVTYLYPLTRPELLHIFEVYFEAENGIFICKEKVRTSDQPVCIFHIYQSPYRSEIILTLYNITKVFLSNSFIHSFSNLSDDRSNASSKTVPPHSAI